MCLSICTNRRKKERKGERERATELRLHRQTDRLTHRQSNKQTHTHTQTKTHVTDAFVNSLIRSNAERPEEFERGCLHCATCPSGHIRANSTCSRHLRCCCAVVMKLVRTLVVDFFAFQIMFHAYSNLFLLFKCCLINIYERRFKSMQYIIYFVHYFPSVL